MRSAMPFLGVRVPVARRIARTAAKGEKDAAVLRCAALDLWDGASHREERYAAMALLALRPLRGRPEIVAVVEHMVRTGQWWDYTDELAHRLADLHDAPPEPTAALDASVVASTTTSGSAASRSSRSSAGVPRLDPSCCPRRSAESRRPRVLHPKGDRLGAAGVRAGRRRLGARVRRLARTQPAQPARGAQAHRRLPATPDSLDTEPLPGEFPVTDPAFPADVQFPADGFALFPDRSVIALRVNGELKDLATRVEATDAVEPVTIDSPDGLSILRHSTAHVLAQAVQRINPQANLGIGPPITDGFYYDFDVAHPFSTDDLKAIDKEMARIVREGQRFVRRVVTDEEARAELVDEPFKLELIGLKGGGKEAAEGASVEVGAGELTIYDNVNRDGETVWKDLCRGTARAEHPHGRQRLGAHPRRRRVLAGEREEPAAAADLRHRLADKDELRAYQQRLEEAAKRDHRKLGRELDLFSFPDEIGSGLSVWHPHGGIMRQEMEQHALRRHREAGYSYVYTPHITKGDCSSSPATSVVQGRHVPGHAHGRGTRRGRQRHPPGADYYLKPMNCPMHILAYVAPRCYRDLPLRIVEFGTVYRNEKSGVIHGLTRVRGMTQDDAHIFTTAGEDEGRGDHDARVRALAAARLRPRRLLPRAVDGGPGEVGR